MVINDLVTWGFIRRSFSYLVGTDKVKGKSKAFWLCSPYENYWKEYCYSR
jgi:hypothetical protein